MKYPYKQAKTKGRRIDEHRLKVEKLIGRKLGRFEFVHHVDEDKRNNEIENLETNLTNIIKQLQDYRISQNHD